MLEMNNKIIAYLAVTVYTLLIIIPIWLALDRLIWVAGFDVTTWLSSLDKNFISQGVLEFTLFQAFFFYSFYPTDWNTHCLAIRKI